MVWCCVAAFGNTVLFCNVFSCVDGLFLSLAQLRVFGAPLPPKVAQPVAERPAVSSTPAPAAATPTHDNQEDAAPAENEGQLVVRVFFLP